MARGQALGARILSQRVPGVRPTP